MKNIIVTTSWDDGHVLDLKLSKLLKKYGIKGTFYVSPNNYEFSQNDLLNKKQVIALSQDFEIGAHTMTHPQLDILPAAEAEEEIRGSKKYLESIIGNPVTSFCYPGGYYNTANTKQVENAGFRIARTTKRFSLDFDDDLYELPTSLQAYDHWLDAWEIAKLSRFNILKFACFYRHWDSISAAMFDSVGQQGGIFHLWGHSWEIEQNNDWARLDKVLKYIGNRPGIKYSTNKESYE